VQKVSGDGWLSSGSAGGTGADRKSDPKGDNVKNDCISLPFICAQILIFDNFDSQTSK